mgnify:CR=1 FL=1
MKSDTVSILEAFFGRSIFESNAEREERESKWAGMVRFRCGKCGQFFGVENSIRADFEKGKIVHCPKGHQLKKKAEAGK